MFTLCDIEAALTRRKEVLLRANRLRQEFDLGRQTSIVDNSLVELHPFAETHIHRRRTGDEV